MKWLIGFLTVVMVGSVQAQETTSPVQVQATTTAQTPQTNLQEQVILQEQSPELSIGEETPVYIPEGMTPESHFWWLSCYSKNNKCCIDNRCTETVSYEEFVRKTVLPEYREKTRVVRVEDWNYGRKIIWIVRGQ